MPKRTDIKKILIIGSGPIVVGQACEFDYSGSQAIKALKKLGYQVVLVNSNPATIMTDPDLADRTYIEPLTIAYLEKIIIKEKPQALLPILGGQTALNLASELAKQGILARLGVELIGADAQAITKAEDRELFKQTMAKIGIKTPKSVNINNLSQGLALAPEIGFPLILRASFTLGGLGSSIVYSKDELLKQLEDGLEASPIHTVLMEEYLHQWKEYELELMRDLKGNQSVVASIENFDPMGVHTGDSITVCPAQTLSDKEYQRMRDMAFLAYEAIGIACGGSNVQFAVNPKDGEIVIIEINPRVSRSSALASKATGFPIAKIAAMLAVGLSLDEITNEITGKTPASFEPAIDYVVVKIPRFNFEKFPGASHTLNSQMKSIGEVMAIGRNFAQAMQKGLRALEDGSSGLEASAVTAPEDFQNLLSQPNPKRIHAVYTALLTGMSPEEIYQLSGIDPWFLRELRRAAMLESALKSNPKSLNSRLLEAKQLGFSDVQLGRMVGTAPAKIENLRNKLGVTPVFYDVDTCAGEFEAKTPYFYSTYEKVGSEELAVRSDKKKVIVLGSGPNRIGQGIEFDYVCVHAVQAIREEGLEAIMINSNPETVSTDYDTADRLYFEPINFEEVMAVVKREQVNLLGLLVGFGGQTPLILARQLAAVLGHDKILGTSIEAIDTAEDRQRFGKLLLKLGISHPRWAHAKSLAEAKRLVHAKKRGFDFPLLVRPSYVLGGRGMHIFYEAHELESYIHGLPWKDNKKLEIYIDQFLEDAVELDVDLICDGKDVVICGIMEHVEEAGIHSGDSSCIWPTVTIGRRQLQEVEKISIALAKGLGVVGLLNIQFALYRGEPYVLEANPRASRTAPFISKARSIPWANIAAKVCLGKKLSIALAPYAQALHAKAKFYAMKTPVFSWNRFPGADAMLGPEMRSTGETMTLGKTFAEALVKTRLSLPNGTAEKKGQILFSLKDTDKPKFVVLTKRLNAMGLKIVATKHTARYLRDHCGIDVREVFKIGEGRPNVVDVIQNKEVLFVVNSPSPSSKSRDDGYAIRTQALLHDIPLVSTPRGLQALCEVLDKRSSIHPDIYTLQEIASA